MSYPIQNNLLRRTTVAIAAAIGLFSAFDSSAASVNVGTSQVCASYSGMSIDPAGNLTVNCSTTGGTGGTGGNTGGNTTPTVDHNNYGVFSLSTSGTGVTAGAAISLQALRTVGDLGGITVPFTATGCTNVSPASGTVSFGGGSTTPVTITATAPQSGTCTIALSDISVGSIGSPRSAAFTVGGSTGGTGGSTGGNTGGSTGGGTNVSTAGCPAGYTPPSDLLTATMPGSGQLLNLLSKSGQITAVTLPALSAIAGARNSGSFAMGESPTLGTPDPMQLDISINKCPGLIDMTSYQSGTPGAACNKHSTTRNMNAIDWLANNIADATTAAAYNMCWTADGGTYYVNVRWTAQTCSSQFGPLVCGFQASVYQGAY